MQQYDNDQCPGRPVQPAATTAESVFAVSTSVSELRTQLAFKQQQLLSLQHEPEQLQAAAHAPASSQQPAAVATAAAECPVQAFNLPSSTNSPSFKIASSPATAAAAVGPGIWAPQQPQCATGGDTAAVAEGTTSHGPVAPGHRLHKPQQQPPALIATDQQLQQLQSLRLLSATCSPAADHADSAAAAAAAASSAVDSVQRLQSTVTAEAAPAVSAAVTASASATRVDHHVQGCSLPGQRQPSAAAAAAAANTIQGVMGVSTAESTAPDTAVDRLTSASAQRPAADQARAAAAAAAAAEAEAEQVEVGQARSSGSDGAQQLIPQQQQQQQQQQQIMLQHFLWQHHQQQQEQCRQSTGPGSLQASPQQSKLQREEELQPFDALQAAPLQLSQLFGALEQPIPDCDSPTADLPAAAADDDDGNGAADGGLVDSTPPAELMAAAAAGFCDMQHSAASTEAPATISLDNSCIYNPTQHQFLHPLVATAAAAAAAISAQAELRQLSDWDNPDLTFKERSQTLASVVAQQQVDLGLDPDWLSEQDLMLLLQPVELEMDSNEQLGEPVDNSLVVARDARTTRGKVKSGRRHVSADHTSSMCVLGDGDLCESGLDSRNESGGVISYQDFAPYFHLAAAAACVAMGMSITTLKMKLREFGINRWPSREYRAIEDAIEFLQSKTDDAKDHAAKPGRILMLRHLRCLLYKYPNMEFEAHPAKDLIYALHKQKYKKRKQQEKEAQLTAAAAAGADSSSAAVAAAAGSSASAGTAGGYLDGASTQQQEQAENGTRNCRRRA